MGGNVVQYPKEVLESLEDFVDEHEQDFLNTFAHYPSPGILALTKLHFSSCNVSFVFVMYEGQHVVDQCSIEDFMNWVDKVKGEYRGRPSP